MLNRQLLLRRYSLPLAMTIAVAFLAPLRIQAAMNAYAISGQMQTSLFPPNSADKFSSFVAKFVIDDSLILNSAGCTVGGNGSAAEAGFTLPASGIDLYVMYSDGTKNTVNLPGGGFNLLGGVVTYCSGTNAIGHTVFTLTRTNGDGTFLVIQFDDAAPGSPAIKLPFSGSFTSTAKIKQGLFQFPGKNASDAADFSASVTCFTALSSAAADPLQSPCGSPAPAIPRPHVLHTYAFSGTASSPQGAKVYGKFVLDEALIYLSPNGLCNGQAFGGAGNSDWSNLVGIDQKEFPLTLVLPDGRTGSTPTEFFNSSAGIQGRCHPGDDTGTPIGPTTLIINDGIKNGIQIVFDDAPPKAPVLVPPFTGLVPATTHFASATFSFSGFYPSLNGIFSPQGTLTCLAPISSPDADPTKSACGDGSQAVTQPPSISSSQAVVNGASFQDGLASNTWITITGSNLSQTTRAWQSPDFIGSNLPTSLDGVQVKINGKSAYVAYISPTQINVLAPDDPATGPVSVQVTNSSGSSGSVTVNKVAFAPAFFAYSAQSSRYAVAQAGATYDLIAPAGLLGSAATTRPASPGETVVLYATGLGPSNPPVATGQLVAAASPLANPVQLTLGGVTATVSFAGLIGPGLYQLNVVVPNLPTGDAAISLKIGDTQAKAITYIPILGK